ncbi:MAG TPA: glycoside hydrolase family 172 protein [Armatimonadota bacterium]
MKHIGQRFVLTLLLLITFALSVRAAEKLTYTDLVQRLTDLEQLAVLPVPGERTQMASSYDRTSSYDPKADAYLNWNANGDGSGFVRQEGDSFVLAEMTGPGCIWRIWSAAPGRGHVKIYLDGATTPALDLPFQQYFDRNAGTFTWPNLVYIAGDETATTRFVPGVNNYVPIPYRQSCKIVADKDWGKYFHFNYTTFPADTSVPTFTTQLMTENAAALEAVNARLGRCGQDPAAPRTGQQTTAQAITVPAGRSVVAADLHGARAITALTVHLALPADAEAQRVLLRQLTLRITWDNETAAAVWAPLGDFFGAVGGAGSFQTLPVGLREDGTFYSYWYMPFAQGARVEIGNDGTRPVDVQVTVTHAPLDHPIGTLGRFHAKWHRDALLPTRADRAIDWTLLATQGRGRLVGAMLHIWTPLGGWWGEGDEKFFVDGEKFPSTFGTGSEDYFGYAWSQAGRFVRPYHAQPLNEDNTGHVDNMRWHISDSVPFQTGFEGAIEKYFPNQAAPYRRYAQYAAVVYWYLAPGGVDPYPVVPVSERVGYWTAPEATYREAGVIEGESLQTARMPQFSHWPAVQGLWEAGAGRWSGDKQLFWMTDHGPNKETLELTLPVEKPGKYRILIRCTRSATAGIAQCSFDGQPLGEPIDYYGEKLAPADPVTLGIVELTAGSHVLQVKLVGKHAAITGRGLSFGLDYIKLIPAE